MKAACWTSAILQGGSDPVAVELSGYKRVIFREKERRILQAIQRSAELPLPLPPWPGGGGCLLSQRTGPPPSFQQAKPLWLYPGPRGWDSHPHGLRMQDHPGGDRRQSMEPKQIISGP